MFCIQIFFLLFQDIDLKGFQKFLDCFLEVSAPEELSQHLFQTFVHAPEKSETKGGAVQVNVQLSFKS